MALTRCYCQTTEGHHICTFSSCVPKASLRLDTPVSRIFNCLSRFHNCSSWHRNSSNRVYLLHAPWGHPIASTLRCRVVAIRIAFLELWPATVLSSLEILWAGGKVAAPTPAPFFIPATSSNSCAAATTYPKSATETSASEEINVAESSPSPISVAAFKPSAISCSDAKSAEDVMVVLTSAVEIYEKLPEHLPPLFRCTPITPSSPTCKALSLGKIYTLRSKTLPQKLERRKEFEHYKKI